MDNKSCNRKLDSLGPVAVKQGQTEVCSPGHDTWGVVSCEYCDDTFEIKPNRIYRSRKSELECVTQIEAILTEDHKKKQAHRNSYELGD